MGRNSTHLVQHVISFAKQRSPEFASELVHVLLHGLRDSVDVAEDCFQQSETQGAPESAGCSSSSFLASLKLFPSKN